MGEDADALDGQQELVEASAAVPDKLPSPAAEPLLWGQWGGVVVIVVVLAVVIVGLTVTVGAVPF